MMISSGGLSLRKTGTSTVTDRRLQDRAVENAGNLHLAGLEGAALRVLPASVRRGSGSAAPGARLMSCWPFSSASTTQPPDRPGIARSASSRNAARSSACKRRRGRQHLRHRDLLAQDRVDRVHQRAGREQDGFAPGLALVVGELPDDPGSQQHERQRHREREQHQAMADTPAFVGDFQGSLLRADGRRVGAALYPRRRINRSAA